MTPDQGATELVALITECHSVLLQKAENTEVGDTELFTLFIWELGSLASEKQARTAGSHSHNGLTGSNGLYCDTGIPAGAAKAKGGLGLCSARRAPPRWRSHNGLSGVPSSMVAPASLPIGVRSG